MTSIFKPTKKRIILCCDGTWQNSDNGYIKPSAKNPVPSLQIPSNVTRISRAFKRLCSDGVFQIVYYLTGVGSRSGIVDRVLGGAFGIGIAENIREAYAYICANYVDGDEIILLGFSRGAFTARSIGGMISDLGLLTREGMEFFYPIFKDMQNWMNPKYKDSFPQLPFTGKPKGANAVHNYREKLVEKGYTRVRQNKGQGDPIRVKAIGVWDTVGALGIPNIEHGFHALALDETRGPFSPTLWERQPEHGSTSDLRQVWFPGSHGNIGGGWLDQGIANITLAWMMDQLASVGCEFVDDALERLFERNVKYYEDIEQEKTARQKCASCCCGCCASCCRGAVSRKKKSRPWAVKHIYDSNHPVRPWSLHTIRSVQSPLYSLVGSVTRSPGLYKKIDPDSGRATRAFLEDTNERVHCSVRTRLACEGLDLNDAGLWGCAALLKNWRPRRVAASFHDPIPQDAKWGPTKLRGILKDLESAVEGALAGTSAGASASAVTNGGGAGGAAAHALQAGQIGGLRWVWEYIGPEGEAPPDTTLVEESMGPYEKHLLALSVGKVQILEYAEKREVSEFKAIRKWSKKQKTKESRKDEKKPEA
ncbi:hypothetical protein F5B20DRAFT_571631 [Whalleya microplaca]|nr:hypothetical protein F5B20DRAFT_571631 [Whalleya microplaca]